MKLKRSWQKGSADLVTVGMAVVIMSIVTAGTGAAISYSRDILLRQENYKKAAYFLRGEMEQSIRDIHRLGVTMDLQARELGSINLQSEYANGPAATTEVVVFRERIEVFQIEEVPGPIDYYGVTCHAQWVERDLSGSSDYGYADRQIAMTTYVPVKD